MVNVVREIDSVNVQVAKTTVLDDADDGDKEKEDSVARLVQLNEQLRSDTLPCFSLFRQHSLAHLLETTLTVQRHSTLLDADAIRYLTSVRCIASVQEKESLGLDYKSFVWAYRSKTQERLLQTLDTLYEDKMDWSLAKRSGIFLWLLSHDDLVTRAERVARQQYSGQDERDPTSCSLLYYALRKEKLVANLWRQAFWHKDQKKMLTFLNNDFSQARWQAAAFKNAFALLSQRRFDMAASFFLLGGGLRDAVNVCTRNLDDLCLGLTIARLYEGGTRGAIFTDLLRKDVLQQAVKTNNRWLAHWALSMLGDEDQAMEALCRPLHTLAFASGLSQEAPFSALHEDAEVTMLFSHLLADRPLPESLPAGIESSLALQSHRILCADGE